MFCAFVTPEIFSYNSNYLSFWFDCLRMLYFQWQCPFFSRFCSWLTFMTLIWRPEKDQRLMLFLYRDNLLIVCDSSAFLVYPFEFSTQCCFLSLQGWRSDAWLMDRWKLHAFYVLKTKAKFFWIPIWQKFSSLIKLAMNHDSSLLK